jgi:hypothetical protein
MAKHGLRLEVVRRKCFMGQPVLITKDQAVLRIALGSDSLRQLSEDFEQTLLVDNQIIEKLELLAKNLSKL